jgi:hypothetical protein
MDAAATWLLERTTASDGARWKNLFALRSHLLRRLIQHPVEKAVRHAVSR